MKKMVLRSDHFSVASEKIGQANNFREPKYLKASRHKAWSYLKTDVECISELFICLLLGGKRGQTGRQTADKENQMEEHKVAGQEELEKNIATLPQQFEDLSVTGTGGSFG